MAQKVGYRRVALGGAACLMAGVIATGLQADVPAARADVGVDSVVWGTSYAPNTELVDHSSTMPTEPTPGSAVPDSRDAELAGTGVPIVPWLVAGLGLAGFGVGMLVFGRRRARDSSGN